MSPVPVTEKNVESAVLLLTWTRSSCFPNLLHQRQVQGGWGPYSQQTRGAWQVFISEEEQLPYQQWQQSLETLRILKQVFYKSSPLSTREDHILNLQNLLGTFTVQIKKACKTRYILQINHFNPNQHSSLQRGEVTKLWYKNQVLGSC